MFEMIGYEMRVLSANYKFQSSLFIENSTNSIYVNSTKKWNNR